MRKWRPEYKCQYVIPEIHGASTSLDTILKRILPLRKSVGQKDSLVFLGDYVDKGADTFSVLNTLIDLKSSGQDISFIRGNHDELFMRALESDTNYDSWFLNGGRETVVSYLQHIKNKVDANTFPRYRLKEIIPKEHINFICSLSFYYCKDDYIFVHGGFDLSSCIEKTSNNTLLFDENASKQIKQAVANKQTICIPGNKIYITSHNYKDEYPFIYYKYYMLGGGAPDKLILFELNSMSCSMIKNHKTRFYKHQFKVHE